MGLERARAVGPRAASRSMHGPDEAGPGVRVLSGLSAGAGQLSEAGPVRVVKVEQPGGPEHRRRKPTIGGPGGPTRRVSKARCVIEKSNEDGGDVGGEPRWSHRRRWVGAAGACASGAAEVEKEGGGEGRGPGCFRIHAHTQDRAW